MMEKRGKSRLDFGFNNSLLLKSKRSQITIFVIIAIMVVALALLIYFLVPGIRQSTSSEKNPNQFIQSCLENEVLNALETLSPQGGSINPGHYILYQGDKIEYLCYTNEDYKTCVMQQPLLMKHIQNEIKTAIENQARNCFNELEKNYIGEGYSVKLNRGAMGVELLPKRVVVSFNNTLNLIKDGSEKFDEFRVVVNNNIYELASIANSILNWEAQYGDSETTLYMSYYRDLKVEKKKQVDGSTIYILTDRNSQNKFQFATRSVAWPPGY